MRRDLKTKQEHLLRNLADFPLRAVAAAQAEEVEQAAGITCGQEVYDFIMAGSEAAGAASGIMNAADPIAMIDEMIAAIRRAADDLKQQQG